MSIHNPEKLPQTYEYELQKSALFEADEQIRYFTARLEDVYMSQLMTPPVIEDLLFAKQYSKLKSEFDNLLDDLENFYNGKLLTFEGLQTDLAQSESHRVAAQIHKIAYEQAFIISKAEQNFYLKSSKLFELSYAAKTNDEDQSDRLLN